MHNAGLIWQDPVARLHKMDKLDVRILHDILESKATSPLDLDVRKPLSSVARRLKVDENTVKNRIEKLRRSGFLKGWWVAVNPNLVGQRMAQVWFDVGSSAAKRPVIQKLSLIPGVAVIKDLFGSSLCVVLFYDSEKNFRRTTELIFSIAGSKGATWMSEPFPACEIALSKDDFRIIRSLQKEPQRPYAGIAQELDISSRTVKRRIRRLVDGNAIYLIAELNPRYLSGGIVCGLLVSHEVSDNKAESEGKIGLHLEDGLLFASLDDPHRGYFAFITENVASVQEVLDWTLAQEGVSEARIDIVQEVISLYGVYEEQLEMLQKGSRRG